MYILKFLTIIKIPLMNENYEYVIKIDIRDNTEYSP